MSSRRLASAASGFKASIRAAAEFGLPNRGAVVRVAVAQEWHNQKQE